MKTTLHLCCLLACIVFASTIHLKPVQRIIRGKDATDGQFPFIVSLQRNSDFTEWIHACGGTIITTSWILTAAHCFVGEEDEEKQILIYRVVAGVKHLLDEDSQYRQERIVSEMYPYQSYKDTRHVFYDLGLLKLGFPLQFNDFIQPGRLPTHSNDCARYGAAIVLGWGKLRWWAHAASTRLAYKELPLVTRKECQNFYIQNSDTFNVTTLDHIICVATVGKSNVASGDSGSPLVQRIADGQMKVFGVANMASFFSGDDNSPSTYRDICKYLDWITEVVKPDATIGN